jgi:putative multiple sugar transport system permease protein
MKAALVKTASDKSLSSVENTSLKASSFFKKYTMTIALVVVFVFFSILTEGRLLYAQNISNLMLQNAYVLVMACGMLLCILTGGNVDLSIGASLCLVASIAAQLLDKAHMDPILTILIYLAAAVIIGMCRASGSAIAYSAFYRHAGRHVPVRGLGRTLLASKTVAISNETFLGIFSSYITVPALTTLWWKPAYSRCDGRRSLWASLSPGAISFIQYSAGEEDKKGL